MVINEKYEGWLLYAWMSFVVQVYIHFVYGITWVIEYPLKNISGEDRIHLSRNHLVRLVLPK